MAAVGTKMTMGKEENDKCCNQVKGLCHFTKLNKEEDEDEESQWQMSGTLSSSFIFFYDLEEVNPKNLTALLSPSPVFAYI